MMNCQERPGFADQATIERLIDGELTDGERRELLLWLEQEPDGWRRCALAFLEDRTFRQALSPAGSAPRALATPLSRPSSGARPKRFRFRRLSIAATLLASTFAAGFAAGGMRPVERRVEVAGPAPPESAPSLPAVEPAPIREVGSVEVVDGSAGESRPERFPIRSGPGLDDRWIRDQPPSVPEYVRARWERQGYQVAERRKLVSVELEDGRRVSIPVDEVKLDYVGKTPL